MIRLPVLREGVRSDLVRLGLLLAGVAAILSYAAVGRAYYAGFHLPQGTGMTHLLPEELVLVSMFTLFGLAAVATLAGALQRTAIADGAAAFFGRLSRRPLPIVAVAAAAVMLTSGAVGRFILGHAVVTDDEHTYRFIAQTLRTGSLTAPSPGGDLDFFHEQFVVLTPQVRYGKYPIGYPALLAAGQALGVERWVVPALSATIVVLVYALGFTLFDASTALLAVALVATSPQLILTGATYLSQPASAVFLLGALAVLAVADRRQEAGRGPATGTIAVAGAIIGYGIFVRPLPGALFAVVLGLAVLWRRRRVRPTVRLFTALAAFALPVVLGTSLLLVQNRLQSGDFFTSGYQTFHATGAGAGGLMTLVGGDIGARAMSVAAGGLRLALWAFGWPLAALLGVAAWGLPRTGILWAIVAASFAYRLISPKAGVSATGPIYMYEVVPVLALLCAAGAVRLARTAGGRGRVSALLMAGWVVSLSMFVPGRTADLYAMGLAQRSPHLAIRSQDVRRAVVFHNGVVPWWTRRSWAYYPRCNSPQLDDDVLFLHLRGSGELPAAREMWKRRYPDRSAWLFNYTENGPRLVPLEWAIRELVVPTVGDSRPVDP